MVITAALKQAKLWRFFGRLRSLKNDMIKEVAARDDG